MNSSSEKAWQYYQRIKARSLVNNDISLANSNYFQVRQKCLYYELEPARQVTTITLLCFLRTPNLALVVTVLLGTILTATPLAATPLTATILVASLLIASLLVAAILVAAILTAAILIAAILIATILAFVDVILIVLWVSDWVVSAVFTISSNEIRQILEANLLFTLDCLKSIGCGNVIRRSLPLVAAVVLVAVSSILVAVASILVAVTGILVASTGILVAVTGTLVASTGILRTAALPTLPGVFGPFVARPSSPAGILVRVS
ncbi:hypothetical protein MAC_09843 [Metarhizium acridum CQMa 102]|uniref:Uncharacterized protein n=1 Tax=Metarhizium acridum (strain CQMa 102) TaxID=655827 RepID=E9EIZ5_METAQ|nr:uncharacterized protein MAC_09843 [Metarhizium acridum CQMa 102]EFY84112.1 hypothetical protein MAC_09843 [Metarhizium acridum CQMa 102]